MNRLFRHSIFVHVIALGGAGFFAFLTHQNVTEPFSGGSEATRFVIVAACVAIMIGLLALYGIEGVNRYEPTDAGLRIHRLFRTTFRPWSEITEIRWNKLWRYVVIRSRAGFVAFISTDFFPDILNLLQIIHQRSDCILPQELETLLKRPPNQSNRDG